MGTLHPLPVHHASDLLLSEYGDRVLELPKRIVLHIGDRRLYSRGRAKPALELFLARIETSLLSPTFKNSYALAYLLPVHDASWRIPWHCSDFRTQIRSLRTQGDRAPHPQTESR